MKNDLIKKLYKITEIFIISLLILFPLLVDKNGYVAILECKYQMFLYITITYFLIINFLILYNILFNKISLYDIIKYKKEYVFILLLLFIYLISTLFSPFFHNHDLFIGVGRGEGLITSVLYLMVFTYIITFSKFNKRYLLYFSISSIFVNFIGILQYFGLNVFDMFKEGMGTYNQSFITTIGNVDFVSALYCILLPVSMYSFIFIDDNNIHENLLHCISLLFGFFLFSIIDVNSGKVGLLFAFIIISPFIFTNSKRLLKSLVVFLIFLFSYFINYFLNPLYYYKIGKILLNIQINYISIGFIILMLILLILINLLKKINYDYSKNKKLIKKIYYSYVIILVLLLLILYFVNIDVGMITEIRELLHGNFNDEFGTYRIFLWKRTLKLIPNYFFFGSGPDTFAIRFMSKYTNDVIALGSYSINDTAGNIYLTMIVNTGIFSLIMFLSLIFLEIKKYLKNYNKYNLVLLLTIITYCAQSFFNLSVVIITPIFWLTLGIFNKSCEKHVE